MKRFLSAFILLFFFTQFSAQFDKEHWFAPMFDDQGNTSPLTQFLHLSTNSATEFTVYVYNNNKIIYQANIKKGSPAAIGIDRQYMITKDATALGKASTMGLYVRADFPFFANFRFGVDAHAEILTSKGEAALGRVFYTVVSPNNFSHKDLNFMTSVIATQDNTLVKIDGFKKPLVFNNVPTQASYTVTLNRGQSYILQGKSLSNLSNLDAFTGAHITADKPISVTNGNFNGQQSKIAFSGDGSDILMDQSVPTDKLGDEFIIVKGYGKIGNDMEGAIVVATQPNTDIYVNNETSPIATLANPGDHFRIDDTKYKPQGSDHYNLYIKTKDKKKIYVYQLMAGVENDTKNGIETIKAVSTGGMNFIPPISCYLPKVIDEISDIDKIGPKSYTTKLNIITQQGATVIVKNGSTIIQTINPSDLKPVSGATDWGTYSILNVTGNISVESTKAVTAGISAGDSNVGYGGFFAGFTRIPLIVNVDENACIPYAILELPQGYTKYEWFNVDDPTTILTEAASPHIFKPTKPGTYKCRITEGSCDPEETLPYKFENCKKEVTDSICGVKTFTPSFKYNTGEAVASINITKQPTKGTVVVSGATFTYTPNQDITNQTDEIEYNISNASGTVTEKVKHTIIINQIIATDTTVGECSTTNSASFDLTKTKYTTVPNFKSVRYYTSPTGAENQVALEEISSPYPAIDGTIVYARIENTLGCHAVRKVTLKIMSAPDVKPENYTKLHCDEEDGKIDGNYKVIFSDVIAGIMTNPAGFTINFFKTKPDAEAPNNALPQNTPHVFTAGNNKIWVRVESDCDLVIKEVELKLGALIPDITTGGTATYKENVCNDVNAYDYLSKFTNETALSATYYKSLPDAQNNVDGITVNNPTTLSTADGVNTFYFRVWKAPAFCARIFKLELTRQSPPKPTFPGAPYHICDDGTSTYTLDAGAGYTSWEWYNDNDPSTMIINSRTIPVKPGKYFVIVKSTTAPCPIKSDVVEVIGEPLPDLDPAKLTRTFCDLNLDDKADLTFSTDVTPYILTNSSHFDDIKYYTNAAMTNLITTDKWSFATDTDVWIKVKTKLCAEVSAKITLKVGPKISLLKDKETLTECGDLDGKYTIKNLNYYRINFTNDQSLNITYHNSKSGAQNNNDIVTSSDLTFTNSKTYYLRISSPAGLCSVLGELKININRPQASTELKDESICSGTTVELKVGSGFKSHVWYKAEDLNTPIWDQETYSASIGNYVVVLEAQNGCKYSQPVKVTQAESAKITAIIIDGTTVTVKAEGGVPPYEYALEGPSYYQGFSSNFVFPDVSKPGLYTVSVKTSTNCAPTTASLSILKIQNTITPNGDGRNDYVDYSELKSKTDAKFIIIDRYGKKVYDSAEKKDYIWDGKLNGKPLPNDTYWYILEWTDLGAPSPTQQKAWILLKNN
ncbi:T9SS type B sorting domain-containing protein [Soonwooa sp.]|uniref:T9SS type B sorting domain-containing protein n=1 Tax=Soonwooa sp. TaxID=1938592 RepID=UPI0035B2D2D9